MKKFLLVLGFLVFIVSKSYAGQTIEHHNFYSQYNPSATIVWDKTGATSTGDQVAVNTYMQKTIQINPNVVGGDIKIVIEGRSASQLNSPQWAILDTVQFGSASADTAIQKIVEVTEYVDFLRVGIQTDGAAGTSAIDVEGLFTNIER